MRSVLVRFYFTAALLILGVVSASAQSLTVDVAPLFDSANTYLPIFMAIFGIPFGIAIAYALVRLIGNAVISAIRGGTV